MATLYLCEKPSQARDIARVLGVHERENGYIVGGDITVTWCLGHLLALAPPDDYCENIKPWRMDVLPIVPKEWRLFVVRKTKSQFDVIKKLLKKADCVVIATDADREGDVIGREVLEFCHYKGEIKRCWLSALDDASIQKALNNIRPGESTYPLYLAGLGRQRADWSIGMNMTMATSCLFGMKGQGVLSVGRVQTPTLNLIVERDRCIEHFKSTDHFELHARFSAAQGAFLARWQAPDALTNGDGLCLKREMVEAIAKKIQGKEGVVTEFDTTLKKTAPPACFSLSSLQKIASSQLGLSAKKTLDIAQSLYERHKATTYPRTDTGFLPDNQFSEAEEVLNALAHIDPNVKALVGPCDCRFKSPVWNDKKVTAHHGIIPTLNTSVDIRSMRQSERAVYDLIRRQYIAQFLGCYEYRHRHVTVVCTEEIFSAHCNTPKALGWKQAMAKNKEETDSEAMDSGTVIPDLKQKEGVLSTESTCVAKQTTPPARFTEGTLIAAMKNIAQFVDDPIHKKTLKASSGIGTEATRADMIEKLVNRDYIRRDKKCLMATERGRELVDLLPEQIKNPATTAMWEQELDNIAEGEGDLQNFLLDQEEALEFMLEDLVQIRQTRGKGIEVSPQYPCPKCPSPLIRRKGKNGFFWGCLRYPNCDGLMQDKGGKPRLKGDQKDKLNLTPQKEKAVRF